MQKRPLLVLAALAAATEPDLGRAAFERFKGTVRSEYSKDPMGSVIKAVLLGSLLFYRAEKGRNPKVKSFYDALIYVSTNLSVGYSDIFAKTETGKAIGTAIMTFGPAMATRMLDEPHEHDPSLPRADAHAIVERLDRILAALEHDAKSAALAER